VLVQQQQQPYRHPVRVQQFKEIVNACKFDLCTNVTPLIFV